MRAAALGLAVLIFLPVVAQAMPAIAPGTGLDVTDLVLAAGETGTLTNNVLTVTGNVSLGAGASLTLTGSTLRIVSDGATVTLAAGARLTLAGGSALRDSLTDIDDGTGADFAYSIHLQAGSTLRVADSFVEGSYGIQSTDAAVYFTGALFRNNRGPVELAGASMLSAVNSSFAGNPNPNIEIMDASSADVRGVGQPTYTVGAGAMFSYYVFGAVEVRDTDGKALGGADWSFETPTGIVAATPRLGGTAPMTLLNREGYPVPQWAAIPSLVDAGGTKSLPATIARVKYAEWTDARVVSTSSAQLLQFTAGNHGLALEDISMHAMLDNMPMDMMMDNMSGDHGSMDMMGMENMTGPMMTQGPGAAFGDFNGDGFVDAVITANPETDEMTLMMMNMTPTDYPAPMLALGDGMGMFMPPGHMPMDHSMPMDTGSMDGMMMTGLESATGATGVSAGDYDGDGDLDLFVSRYGNVGMAMEDMATMEWHPMAGTGLKSMLFQNDGHGMFTEVTAAAGIAMPARHTVGGVWGDYNRDGCLDLYIVNMGELIIPMPMDGGMMPMSTMGGMDEMHGMGMSFIKNESNYLYKNNCDGTFSDVTGPAGEVTGGGAPGGEGVFQSLVEDMDMMYWMGNLSGLSPAGSGISYTAIWVDVDEDGWPDLMVANDFGVSPLYRNNGDGTFTLWTQQAGLQKLGSAMGFAVADFNRDGHLDIFQSNFNEDFLWMSNGDGTFTDRAAEWGVADMAVGWGVGAPDINNDGYPDIAISAGYMSMMMKASERSVLYMNDEGRRFWDVSAPSGFSTSAQGISIVLADINADGKMDLFRGNVNASNEVYLNRESAGGFVHLDLHGLASNSFGVGAEVTALIGGKAYKTVVQPGGEYASSNEPGVWIGLGSAHSAQRVTIYWPSGLVQSVGDLPSGTSMVVREQTGSVVDAGPDGSTNTSSDVMLYGTLKGVALPSAQYEWTFHSPIGDATKTGANAMFSPTVPGLYSVELVVYDRFGEVYGSDLCIMRVADTSAPVINVISPATITATGRPTFNASGTVDNDPAFALAGKFEWKFKLGSTEVSATGAKPTVQLPKPGVWNVTITVTDPSGNTLAQSFDARVTGAGPAMVTQDMVLLAIMISTVSIIAVAVLSSRVWRGGGAVNAEVATMAGLQASDILVPGDRKARPFSGTDESAAEEE
jgi:hypothetical protein